MFRGFQKLNLKATFLCSFSWTERRRWRIFYKSNQSAVQTGISFMKLTRQIKGGSNTSPALHWSQDIVTLFIFVNIITYDNKNAKNLVKV